MVLFLTISILVFMRNKKINYKLSGVDYDLLDPLKIFAQKQSKTTSVNIQDTEFIPLEESRGESAYIIDAGEFYLASTEECLGTKCLVADAMREFTSRTFYDCIAQDTVAMMVNDVVTVGARPLLILAYWATGSKSFFRDKTKIYDLVLGWKKACNLSGAIWGGGETPTLTGVVEADAVDLAGACVGVIQPKNRLVLGDKLQAGDVMVMFESSGIHANGLSLARKIADKLAKGYATLLDDGSMYGEALLKPTHIYSQVVQDLFENNVNIHYIVNITGHGWRKIMRYKKPFTYRITNIPPVPPVLNFIKQEANLNNNEAYGVFNMGAGFAVYVPQKDANKVVKIANKHKIKAYMAGKVEQGEKQIIIEPKKVVYKGESLNLSG